MKKIYKTPEHVRLRMKQRRDAIKAAGGQAYQDLLERERQARAFRRKNCREQWRSSRKKREKESPNWLKRKMVERARHRGRKRGLEATIKLSDIVWPTHCPVLGLELDYVTRKPHRKGDNPANPSLDRFDPTKGYVPGNVFVISMRASTLKNNATVDEMRAVLRYMRSSIFG